MYTPSASAPGLSRLFRPELELQWSAAEALVECRQDLLLAPEVDALRRDRGTE
jgi:hypothetical protein